VTEFFGTSLFEINNKTKIKIKLKFLIKKLCKKHITNPNGKLWPIIGT